MPLMPKPTQRCCRSRQPNITSEQRKHGGRHHQSGLARPRLARREVEAGRLDPEDDFRKLAAAGGAVLGDVGEFTAHRCKRGDFFFYGAACAAILASVLVQFRLSPLWLIFAGLVIGWYLNEQERKRIKAEISARRSSAQ